MKLDWNKRPHSYGLDKGVLYLPDDAQPWDGLLMLNEDENADAAVTYYFDGRATYVEQFVGDFKAGIQCYTYPFELDISRGPYNFSYQTRTEDDGYLIHLLYNCRFTQGSLTRSAISSDVGPAAFTFDISTTPVPVPGSKPTAHLVLDSQKASNVFSELEGVLYGTETTDPRMPSPEELTELYDEALTLRVTYEGDGSYTISGPDDMVIDNGDGTFDVISPTAYFDGAGRFSVSSL